MRIRLKLILLVNIAKNNILLSVLDLFKYYGYLKLTEDKAKVAGEILNKMALARNLMQHECRSDIPEYYIKSIKQLVSSDDGFRTAFYKIMSALGSKYLDRYKSILNNL